MAIRPPAVPVIGSRPQQGSLHSAGASSFFSSSLVVWNFSLRSEVRFVAYRQSYGFCMSKIAALFDLKVGVIRKRINSHMQARTHALNTSIPMAQGAYMYRFLCKKNFTLSDVPKKLRLSKKLK